MATYAVFQPPLERSSHCKSHHTRPHHLSPPASKSKPKLSLNTTPNRSFGRASTGLRLDTLSPSSPTRSNTYKNSYDPQTAPQIKTPLPRLDTSNTTADSAIPPSTEPEQERPFFSYQYLENEVVPYSLPPQTSSILTNGPLTESRRSSRNSSTSSKSGADSEGSTPKKVCFKDPLHEEIRTTEYLLAHSDLRSRSVSPALGPAAKLKPLTPAIPQFPPKAREVAPNAQNRKHARAIEDDSESSDDNSAIPKTPVAGRSKKEREWVWTLGPMPGVKSPGSHIPYDVSDEENLDDSLNESVAAALGFSSHETTPLH